MTPEHIPASTGWNRLWRFSHRDIQIFLSQIGAGRKRQCDMRRSIGLVADLSLAWIIELEVYISD